MRGLNTPRAMAVAIAVLLVVVGAYFYVLTAFPQTVHHCYAQTFGVEIMTLDNRTYCRETVSAGTTFTRMNSTSSSNWTTSTGTTDAVLFGFSFAVSEEAGGELGTVHVTVTEPSGTTYHGVLAFGGPYRVQPTTWFTPDNESGLYVPSFQTNVTLLVEAAS